MKLPYYFTRAEAEWLLRQCQKDDPHRLKKAIAHLCYQLQEQEDKQKELSARHRANQHWVESNETIAKDVVARKEKKLTRHERLAAAIGDLSEDQQAALLTALKETT